MRIHNSKRGVAYESLNTRFQRNFRRSEKNRLAYVEKVDKKDYDFATLRLISF